MKILFLSIRIFWESNNKVCNVISNLIEHPLITVSITCIIMTPVPRTWLLLTHTLYLKSLLMMKSNANFESVYICFEFGSCYDVVCKNKWISVKDDMQWLICHSGDQSNFNISPSILSTYTIPSFIVT